MLLYALGTVAIVAYVSVNLFTYMNITIPGEAGIVRVNQITGTVCVWRPLYDDQLGWSCGPWTD